MLATHAVIPQPLHNPAAFIFCACLYFNTLPYSLPPTPNLSGRWDIKCWEVLSSGHQKDASWVSHPHRLQITALHHENSAAVHKTLVGGEEDGKRHTTGHRGM